MSNKYLIATPIWKRDNIFKIFVKNNNKFGDILAIGSEGNKSRSLAESLGCYYEECDNEPFGKKLNKRVEWFLDNKAYTHIIFLGSDNLIDKRIFNLYNKYSKKYNIISFSDIYFYNFLTKKSYYSAGYKNHRRGEPFAPGRCFSRKIIEKIGPKLWSEDLNRWPDGNLWSKIKKFDDQIILSCKKNKAFLIDIKTNNNLNSYEIMKTTNETYDTNRFEKEKMHRMIYG